MDQENVEKMDGFTRRKEQSKEDIRKAAWELFSQFGVEKVSVTDIARKAGVSHATIYNNFGSKDVLIREFVTGMVAHLVNRAQEIMTPGQPFAQKMAAFFQFIAEMMANSRPMRGSPIFTGSVDLQNDPEIRQIRDVAAAQMIQLLLELVAEGQAQGEVNPELTEEALVIYFQGFMDIFVNSEFQLQFAMNPALVHELGALMLHGLSRKA